MGQSAQGALLKWYARHRRDLPWRRTRDPYAILVSEVMLQQTQVERVVPKYLDFLRRFPDFASLAEAGVGDVIRAWSPLGYNRRAVRLWRVAREVEDRHGGRLPDDPAVLGGLEGVGDYTAAAVGCFAFGRQTPVVDTNVRRVLGRLLWGAGVPSPKELGSLAREMLPTNKASEWNQGLMDLGAAVCLARRPRCGDCPLLAHCRAAPLLAGGGSALAEERASYRVEARRAAPFKGSARYYRGRVLERLRAMTDGESIAVAELGRAVKGDFADADLPWLAELVAGLERDGLLTTRPSPHAGATRVALP